MITVTLENPTQP